MTLDQWLLDVEESQQTPDAVRSSLERDGNAGNVVLFRMRDAGVLGGSTIQASATTTNIAPTIAPIFGAGGQPLTWLAAASAGVALAWLFRRK